MPQFPASSIINLCDHLPSTNFMDIDNPLLSSPMDISIDTVDAITSTPIQSPHSPPSLTPGQQTILLLRPAVYHTDPLLLYDIFQTVSDCDGLTNHERLVLLGVLPNLPSIGRDRNALLRRLLALSVDQLRLLSSLFERGLIAARSIGVRPATPARAVTNAGLGLPRRKRSFPHADMSQIPTKRPRFTISEPENCDPVKRNSTELGFYHANGDEQQPPSQPNPAMGPSLASIVALLLSLGIPQTLPGSGNPHSSERFTQQGSLTNDCLSRQHNTCPITGRMNDTYPLETAHLVPHAIENIDVASYWRFLNLCFGTALTSHIYEIVGGSNSFLSTNGISLDLSVHHMFGRGTIFFIPFVPDDKFDSKTTRYYDVEFRWRGTMAGLVGMNTQLPQLPREQVDENLQSYKLMSAARPISIGDRFRLFTRDPACYPLPHPLLLSLHSMLWDMIAGAGLAGNQNIEHSRVRPTGGDANCGDSVTPGRSKSSWGSESSSDSATTTDLLTTPLARPRDHRHNQHYRPTAEFETPSAATECSGGTSSTNFETTPIFSPNKIEHAELTPQRSTESPRGTKINCSEEEEEEEEEAEGWEESDVSPELLWGIHIRPEMQTQVVEEEMMM